MPDIKALSLNPKELRLAREWVKDCQWGDIEDENEVDLMSDLQIEKGIARNYAGGIEEFKRSCIE
jgi:hypothetical protein